MAEIRKTAGFYFEEDIDDTYQIKTELKQVFFSGKSDFQSVQVIETAAFGRTLVMDDKTQSTEVDEKVYHESLVHPAMLAHGSPKTVFIGGGGEFATAREVLRHSSVEKCVMVDIDQVACEMCLKHLPEWADGCDKDPRFEVYYEDAKAWVENYDGKFDVIIMDICDPIEAGPGIALYFQEFYKHCLEEKLNPGGVLVTQSGCCSILNSHECFSTIHNTLKTVFKNVYPYSAPIPSFGCDWGFNLAFNECANENVPNREPADVDAAIASAISDDKGMKFLDGVSYRGQMNLPKQVRDVLAKEDRVMTKETPVFMH
jgi:spermidine synthase